MNNNRTVREKELIDSGLVSSIKSQYNGIAHNIPDFYFVLIADYIDSMSQLENFNVDYMALARSLPSVLTKVQEQNLDIYGRTDDNMITMNAGLNYETKKMFFFHELTHALQTGKGFYNGNTGMFLTEGATQFTAEILYHVSSGTNLNYRQQPNVITGQPHHTPTSPLSQYQFNGSILYMFSLTTKLPLNQILGLAFNPNGREILKQHFEQLQGNEGKFEEFMFDLEKIYSIEKLAWSGYGQQLSNQTPSRWILSNGATFDGNFQTQSDLMVQTQRNLMASFVLNNDDEYVLANYQKIMDCLTTNELKIQFGNAIQEIRTMATPQQVQQNVGTEMGTR